LNPPLDCSDLRREEYDFSTPVRSDWGLWLSRDWRGLFWGVSGSNDNDATLHDFDTLGFLAFMILLSFFGRSGVSGFLTSMRFLFFFSGLLGSPSF
jgi:hypothetical protein